MSSPGAYTDSHTNGPKHLPPLLLRTQPPPGAWRLGRVWPVSGWQLTLWPTSLPVPAEPAIQGPWVHERAAQQPLPINPLRRIPGVIGVGVSSAISSREQVLSSSRANATNLHPLAHPHVHQYKCHSRTRSVLQPTAVHDCVVAIQLGRFLGRFAPPPPSPGLDFNTHLATTPNSNVTCGPLK